MYLNLINISPKEIKASSEAFVRDLENGTCPVVTDQCDYYSGKIYRAHENMTRLIGKENSSCSDITQKGSKPIQKAMRRR